MVNENKGMTYQPKPFYNRKLIRSVLRNIITQKDGQHNVSRKMSYVFHNMRRKQVEVADDA